MKLRPVTKFNKRNTAISKNMTMTSFQQIVTSLSFFRFKTNLEQSRSRIPDAWSVKLIFSLTVTFYLINTENRTKKSVTQLSYYCTIFEKKLIFAKKMLAPLTLRGYWN